MKRSYGLLAGLTLVAMVCAQTASAQTTYYVSPTGSGTQDGLSWANTMAGIQTGIDASADNPASVVWVSNGTYETGGETNWPDTTGAGANLLTNRVVINKGIIVRSLNGPDVTIIKGGWDSTAPDGTNSVYPMVNPLVVRCVYMTNDAWLIGFMLTNGATANGGGANYDQGGGVWCNSTNSYITNCVFSGNRAHGSGAAVRRGTLYDCEIKFSAVPQTGGDGGATRDSTLFNCTVSQNSNHGGTGSAGGYSSFYGCMISSNRNWYGGCYGGALQGCAATDSTISYNTSYHNPVGFGGIRLTRCLLYRNYSQVDGIIGGYNNLDGWGGLNYLKDCTIAQNTTVRDGALRWVYAEGCTIVSNRGRGGNVDGAAAMSSVLTNCLVAYNSANGGGQDEGGGTFNGTNYNCTIVSNYAGDLGGGVHGSVNFNCISMGNNVTDENYTAYFSRGDNYPLTDGNTNVNALFAGPNDFRLSVNSPLIDVGSNMTWMSSSSIDLLGYSRSRNAGPDMGAYEFPPPAGTVVLVQ